MTNLLFSTPWWLTAAIIEAGIVVWFAGNKRTDTRIRWTGVAIVAVGVLLGIISLFVETDQQKVTRESKELVQSVVSQDWAKVQSLLDPSVSLSVLNLPAIYRSRDELLKGAKDATQKYGLRSSTASVDDVSRQGQILTTTLRVYSDADYGAGHPIPSTWQLDWEKSASGPWQIRDIRCIEVGTMKGADTGALFPKGK